MLVLTSGDLDIIEIVFWAGRHFKGRFNLVGIVRPFIDYYPGPSNLPRHAHSPMLLWDVSEDADAVLLKMTYGDK